MVRSMLYSLDTLPWTLSILIIITAFILLAIAAIVVMRKKGSLKNLKAHHDVSSAVFANLGVLYAVLLGFTVVNVQQRFDQISGTAKLEAANLAELYRDAEVFSPKDRAAITQAIKNYGSSIVEEEWKEMDRGANPQTTKMLNQIWSAYYDVDLSSRKQEILYTHSIEKLNNLISVRLSRLMGGVDSLNDEMWTFLLFGGIIIVAFISVFAFESLWLHVMLASILASATAFLLFLIYSLDSAFTGSVKIDPEALESVLKTFA
jgi:hypothetical protein